MIKLIQRQATIPGPDCHIGNSVVISHYVLMNGQVLVEYVKLAFGFHGKAVDGVFPFFGRIGIEMTKSTAQVWSTANLPEQP